MIIVNFFIMFLIYNTMDELIKGEREGKPFYNRIYCKDTFEI